MQLMARRISRLSVATVGRSGWRRSVPARASRLEDAQAPILWFRADDRLGPLMASPREDAAPRSGSATPLLMTVIGLYLRRIGGRISTADLVALAQYAAVSEPLARTSIARLKKRGVLVPDASNGSAGYRLSVGVERIFERGDRRIFHVHRMESDDAWCVISFSIPESQRAVRGLLRRRLVSIGAGLISPALWICPDHLRCEVEQILTELDVRSHAVLFTTSRPRVAGSLSDAVAHWWDLPRLAALHRQFAESATRILDRVEPAGVPAFRGYVIGIDAWRVVSYLDPGLPYDLLPPDWPGRRAEMLFATLSALLAEPAWEFVADTVGIEVDVSRRLTGRIPTSLSADC